ncbi:hypothetical protein GCM10009841_02940 [Microlunatus panaciterrae]
MEIRRGTDSGSTTVDSCRRLLGVGVAVAVAGRVVDSADPVDPCPDAVLSLSKVPVEGLVDAMSGAAGGADRWSARATPTRVTPTRPSSPPATPVPSLTSRREIISTHSFA